MDGCYFGEFSVVGDVMSCSLQFHSKQIGLVIYFVAVLIYLFI